MRLVEAVELVDIDAENNHEQSTFSNYKTSKNWGTEFTYEAGAKYNAKLVIPDDRIWLEGIEMTLSSNTRPVEFEDRLQNREGHGVVLLKYVKI